MSFLGGQPNRAVGNRLGGLLDPLWAILGGLWSLKWCFLGVFGDLGTISVDLGSNFVVLRSILVDLGSILIDFGSNLVPLKVDFSAFPMLFRSSGASRSQKSRTSFRLGMGESKCSSRLARTSEKSIKIALENAS